MIIKVHNEEETCEFAEQLAESLVPGDVVALSGELGAGKSVFARALMRAMGVMDEAMPSPTFAIIQEYMGRGCRIAHMDWYRLGCVDELEAIGVRDYMQAPWICIIEWPERGEALIPESARRIVIATVSGEPEMREITLS